MAPPADDPTRWIALQAYLETLPASLPARPDALLVISAHWEQPQPTVLAAARPGLLFDYTGFPAHTYEFTYPAPGAPQLAGRVRGLLRAAGIASDEESARGFDHGVFVPLKVSFPGADIPILQLSLQAGLEPARHLAIGKALEPLRDQNVLVIGSGLSFHNLQALGAAAVAGPAREFDRWLTASACAPTVAERDERLGRWTTAPYARLCHPREEHLLPLMGAAGAAGAARGRQTGSGTIWGKAISAYQFG